jgi:hypothetical protein
VVEHGAAAAIAALTSYACTPGRGERVADHAMRRHYRPSDL